MKHSFLGVAEGDRLATGNKERLDARKNRRHPSFAGSSRQFQNRSLSKPSGSGSSTDPGRWTIPGKGESTHVSSASKS
jgi:hypothetical protein